MGDGKLAWSKNGTTTLGVAGDTITVDSLPDKRFYMILKHQIQSGEIFGRGKLNNDAGSNYSSRFSSNGAADGTLTDFDALVDYSQAGSLDQFGVNYIYNLSTKEKLQIAHAMNQGASGAGTAPNRREATSKWVNTTDPISRYDSVNAGAGDFAADSEVVVLGTD